VEREVSDWKIQEKISKLISRNKKGMSTYHELTPDGREITRGHKDMGTNIGGVAHTLDAVTDAKTEKLISFKLNTRDHRGVWISYTVDFASDRGDDSITYKFPNVVDFSRLTLAEKSDKLNLFKKELDSI